MNRLFDIPIDTVRGLVRFLAMAEHDFWEKAAWDKQTRDMDRRAIGVSSIFDAAFLYLPFFVTVLRYLLPPNIPLMQKVKLNCGRKWYKDVKSTRQWQDRMLSNQKIKRVPFPITLPWGVRVLIEVSSVYSFYVDLFIYLFIYYFAS